MWKKIDFARDVATDQGKPVIGGVRMCVCADHSWRPPILVGIVCWICINLALCNFARANLNCSATAPVGFLFWKLYFLEDSELLYYVRCWGEFG